MPKTFSSLFPKDLTYQRSSRIQKGKKIIAVLKDRLGDVSNLTCLDVGCSIGIITRLLGSYFKSSTGVDVDGFAIKKARNQKRINNISFFVSKEDKLPFKDESFDVVICNQVYEHVKDPKILMKEIKRVLMKGGVCFFGARNKYGGPFDGHYCLPFIAWLPKRLADLYLRLFLDKEEYDINLYSLKSLKKLVSAFGLVDYTCSVIQNPRKFNAQDSITTTLGVNKMLAVMAKTLYPFIPNYIWLLEKK